MFYVLCYYHYHDSHESHGSWCSKFTNVIILSLRKSATLKNAWCAVPMYGLYHVCVILWHKLGSINRTQSITNLWPSHGQSLISKKIRLRYDTQARSRWNNQSLGPADRRTVEILEVCSDIWIQVSITLSPVVTMINWNWNPFSIVVWSDWSDCIVHN